jgi:MFS transporter
LPELSNSASEYVFGASERPLFPGSPFAPMHSRSRRLAYACVGALIGASATFTNALVNVNAGNLGGSLGLTLAQVSVLPAIYIAMNATANLTLVRARAEFGIPQVTLAMLGLYASASLTLLVMPSYPAAIAVRAACGVSAASLTTLTIYYFMQTVPIALRPLALVIGISLTQFGTPLARLVPLEVLATSHWHGLALIEFGVALLIAAAILAVPLPPSERSKAFEPLDFVTIALMVPAFLLICMVLGEGRLLWWTDRSWLGWSLACSVPLVAAAVIIEHNRLRPLLQTRWIGSRDILRFIAVALLVRVTLAEQTYGSVGFLTSGGLTNDQLHTLFVYVLGAMLLGMATACVTLSERRLPYQVLAASMIIAFGAWLDSLSTTITRPEQLYLSQSLIAFGTTLFIGPTLAYGFIQMLRKGPTHLVSLIVVFSMTQNVGGLAGSAILGTAQVLSAKAHSAALAEHLIAADPQVAARIQSGIVTISGVLGDPVLRGAQGAGLLGRAMANEANTLAFNDVFRLVMWLALATAAYLVHLIVIGAMRRRRDAMAAA